jgi:hypothetical protein
MSLREVLVGMIEEYARHMGHVDRTRVLPNTVSKMIRLPGADAPARVVG